MRIGQGTSLIDGPRLATLHLLLEISSHGETRNKNVTTRSSAEAEYKGMVHGICELLWLRILLTEIGFKPKEPMLLYCDN